MKPKRIAREPEACNRLGCRRTKFRTDYRFNDPADPNVPGTSIARLRAVHLGVRNVGYLDGEIDELIEALAELRDTQESSPKQSSARSAGRRANKIAHHDRKGAT
jgi:hypothetical protein